MNRYLIFKTSEQHCYTVKIKESEWPDLEYFYTRVEPPSEIRKFDEGSKEEVTFLLSQLNKPVNYK